MLGRAGACSGVLGRAGGAGLTSWKVFSQTSVARLQHLRTDVATRINTTSQLSSVSRSLMSEPHMFEMLEHIEPHVRSVRWNGTPEQPTKRSGRHGSFRAGAGGSAERIIPGRRSRAGARSAEAELERTAGREVHGAQPARARLRLRLRLRRRLRCGCLHRLLSH